MFWPWERFGNIVLFVIWLSLAHVGRSLEQVVRDTAMSDPGQLT